MAWNYVTTKFMHQCHLQQTVATCQYVAEYQTQGDTCSDHRGIGEIERVDNYFE